MHLPSTVAETGLRTSPTQWQAFLAKCYRLWLTPVVIDAADLKAIPAPLLVIAGDKDFASVEDTAEIYRGLGVAQ